MLTVEELRAIQSDCMADDVPIDDSMFAWTAEQVIEFFESGGEVRPAQVIPLTNEANEASVEEPTTENTWAGGEVSIGGITLPIRTDLAAPELVPWVGNDPLDLGSQGSLGALRWLMTQLALGQDMMLLTDPGPRARRLGEWICALLGREVEYVGITRDTTESDLKQRREIRRGTVAYEAAPPLRAALYGRVLLLEGVEKAERNVLPLLNNLLENREMALEDGSFLSASLPSACSDDRSAAEAGLSGAAPTSERVLRCHPDFVVLGLGLPQPAYAGNALDPPLRSRFSCRRPPASEVAELGLQAISIRCCIMHQ